MALLLIYAMRSSLPIVPSDDGAGMLSPKIFLENAFEVMRRCALIKPSTRIAVSSGEARMAGSIIGSSKGEEEASVIEPPMTSVSINSQSSAFQYLRFGLTRLRIEVSNNHDQDSIIASAGCQGQHACK
jgi:hypothetical protein